MICTNPVTTIHLDIN